MDLDKETGNIYESVNIIARRANQISTELKAELNRKLADFSSPTDTMEETFENREQIEISRYYERLPKPVIIATEEFLDHEPALQGGQGRRDEGNLTRSAMASDSTARLPLEGRRILLGITGSIAAYKAAVLCRLLKTAGAEVRVVMTPLAKQFITPLTMATLSKKSDSGGVLRPGERRMELPRLAERMGRLLPDRPGHGQHAGQNGSGHRGQPAAHDLSFGTLSGRRGPGHGPRHVRPRGDAAEPADARGARRADRGAGRRRAGQRSSRQGPHGRTGRNRRIRRRPARRPVRRKKKEPRG